MSPLDSLKDYWQYEIGSPEYLQAQIDKLKEQVNALVEASSEPRVCENLEHIFPAPTTKLQEMVNAGYRGPAAYRICTRCGFMDGTWMPKHWR